MAKPNYSFEKRQRELAKKKKKEEKRLRKLEPNSPVDATDDSPSAEPPGTQDPLPDSSGDKSDTA